MDETFKIKKKIFIVDSDNNKWGKFIGSINKRINKPNIIKNSDLICVSSLSFYDEIIFKTLCRNFMTQLTLICTAILMQLPSLKSSM